MEGPAFWFVLKVGISLEGSLEKNQAMPRFGGLASGNLKARPVGLLRGATPSSGKPKGSRPFGFDMQDLPTDWDY